MNLIADERILAFARELLDGEPVFRATTLWFEPKTAHEDGSWHRDVQFMNPDEAQQQSIIAARSKPGGIQLQIALAETADNEYVPGSHLRWDTEEEYRIRLADEQVNSRANDMPGAIRIHQRPGDALAFEALGLHRGRYHTDKRRRTLMLTYTSDRERIFDYFSDQPWILRPGSAPDSIDTLSVLLFGKTIRFQRCSCGPLPARWWVRVQRLPSRSGFQQRRLQKVCCYLLTTGARRQDARSDSD